MVMVSRYDDSEPSSYSMRRRENRDSRKWYTRDQLIWVASKSGNSIDDICEKFYTAQFYNRLENTDEWSSVKFILVHDKEKIIAKS